MTDQMLLENYLLILKSTVEVYVHGTLESSNEQVRKTLQDGLNNTLCMQNDTYQQMTKKGWYQIENVSQKEIAQTLNKINKKA